jgi:subtilisin family serine protease
VKVLDDHGVGSTSVIAAGIIWAVDRGSRVINLSLGAPATTEALSEAVRYALSKGALVVAAAGNDGSTFPFYPAADPGVISVAGTDERDGLYTWSNRGAPVRFGAPGCNIAPWPGSRLVEFCGTSSAAPVVSGTVALMVSAKPAAAPSEVESDLSKFAVPVPDVGRGRIDAARAVAAVSTTAVTHATVRSNGRPASYRLTAAAGVVEATLTSASATSFTITLRDARGRTLAVASGRAPVRLTRTIPAGPYTISARSSTTRNRFTVNVSYPREA